MSDQRELAQLAASNQSKLADGTLRQRVVRNAAIRVSQIAQAHAQISAMLSAVMHLDTGCDDFAEHLIKILGVNFKWRTRDMTRKLIAAAAILAASAAAYAMTNGDTDGDGALSMAEFMTAYPDLTPEHFVDADTDANGMISEAELAEAKAAGIIPVDKG